MKIAIDGSLLSGTHSGVELAILGLLTGLSRIPTHDSVLAYVGRKFQSPDLPAGCVRLRRAASAGNSRLRRILWQQTMLPLYLKAEKVDVFHGPGYVLPVFSKTPSVVTVYDIIALVRPDLCSKSNVAHYSRVLPRSIKKATRVIVPTRAVARQIVDKLNISEDKIRVIPCGIDARFKPVAQTEIDAMRAVLELNDPYLLFVGNIEPKKNIANLLQAFFAAKVNKKLPHKLVLAGKPAWGSGKVLKLIDSLGLADDVLMTGYLDSNLLPALYSGADALVFPSLIEGFGLPPLEAMACGTPAIISKDPALQETSGPAALSVDAEDIRQLREAIERIIQSRSLRHELAAKGKQRAAQFTWVKAAQATLDVYREVNRLTRDNIAPEDLL